MRSKIVGFVEFDQARLDKDLARIEEIEFSRAYAEYACGSWSTCMIWNFSGSKDDSVLREYDGWAKVTEIGKPLEYINEVINENFNTEYLKSVRILKSEDDGIVLPHRDFLEFSKGFSRFQLPLYITDHSYNSENQTVYRMRQGEIWHVEAREVHCGGTFGKNKKINLLIDFAPDIPIETLIKKSDKNVEEIVPDIIERRDLSKEQLETITTMGQIVNETNFRDMVNLLSKVHFFYQASAEDLGEWMVAVAETSNNPKVMQMALDYKGLLFDCGPNPEDQPQSLHESAR